MIYDLPLPPPPPSFIHVDLDGLWTLADCYGFDRGNSFAHDPIYQKALPRLLTLFDRLGLKATFFLVGRDMEIPGKRQAACEILRRGHDIANHTYHHPFGLEALPSERIRDEIERAQAAIVEATGHTPIGFRAPGYDAGPKLLKILSELNFQYDGSSLPTRWGPVLRFSARRIRGRVRREFERASSPDSTDPIPPEVPEAVGQYGPGSGGAWGLAPQFFRSGPDARPLTRFPLATSPVFRLPLHASLGVLMGRGAVKSGLSSLVSRRWPMTYLLHGIDLAAPEEIVDFLPKTLSKSQAFSIPLPDRESFVTEVLEHLLGITQPELTACYLERTGAGNTPNPILAGSIEKPAAGA